MVDIDKFKAFLTQMEAEDGSRARRRDVVESLNVLVRSTRSKTVVEVGNSAGYISLWLALATKSTGGTLHIYDDDKDRLSATEKMLGEVGFDQIVYHAELPSSGSIPENIDFVVLDHDRKRHLEFYRVLFPNVSVGGTVVTDDSIAEFADLREYINEVRMGDRSSSVLFPLGEGMEVTTKSAADDPLNSLYTDLIR